MSHSNEFIQFQRVSKAWGEHVVLDGLDFSVAKGEKLSIIGPSGSGKTTILRILMTLERPSSGEVFIDEQILWDESEIRRKRESRQLKQARRRVGMVFQQFNLFPHMTALENVMEAPIRSLGIEKDQAKEKGIELLQMVGLADHLNHKPSRMSGGQQQRVAIARALAMRPEILLFDEPTSALDPELTSEVLNVIRDLAESTDITMLMVTHEMRFAEEVSDRVVMFDQGRVVESSEPSLLFHSPEQERTKKFLRAIGAA